MGTCPTVEVRTNPNGDPMRSGVSHLLRFNRCTQLWECQNCDHTRTREEARNGQCSEGI